MRPPRALLLALVTALVCVVTVGLAPPSAAGGPTSVLIVDPANQRAAALYASDERYLRLSDLVGASEAPAGVGEPPPGADSGLAGGVVTVTWLAHDVDPWRVDRIHLNVPGGPWIASHTGSEGQGLVGDGDPRWHRAAHPEALVELLGALGMGSAGTGPSAGGTPPGPEAGSPGTAVPAAAAAAAPAATAPAGPLWGFGGVLVGVALVLGAGRARRVTRRVPHGADAGRDTPSGAGPATTARV